MTFPDGYRYTFLLSARGATIWSILSLRSKGPSCYPLEAPLFRVFIHYGDFPLEALRVVVRVPLLSL